MTKLEVDLAGDHREDHRLAVEHEPVLNPVDVRQLIPFAVHAPVVRVTNHPYRVGAERILEQPGAHARPVRILREVVSRLVELHPRLEAAVVDQLVELVCVREIRMELPHVVRRVGVAPLGRLRHILKKGRRDVGQDVANRVVVDHLEADLLPSNLPV